MVLKGLFASPLTCCKRKLQLLLLVLLLYTVSWKTTSCTAANNVYTFTIEEEKPKGTAVGVIPTWGSNSRCSITNTVPQQGDGSFTCSISGSISTNKVLDRESIQVGYYNLTIVDVISSNIKYYYILIYLQDINDNTPSFVGGRFASVTLSEGHSSFRYKIIAVDRDNGINSTQKYNIISGNIADVFKLDTKRDHNNNLNAYLVLNSGKELDRERRDFYSLNISASDGGTPPRKDFLQLNVSVSDLNDNPPVFNSSNYTVFIREDKKPSTSIIKVFATDKDIGMNAKIYYSIINSDPNNEFSIDKDTGVISPIVKLDYETKKSYKLSVKAENSDSNKLLFSITVVNIFILDVNDNDPVVHVIYTIGGPYQVLENANIGQEVARVSVSDKDSGKNGEVNVTLEGGDGYFSMKYDAKNSESVIYVGQHLDREKNKDFILTASCVDNGVPTRRATKRFKINVGDVNDNYPKCERHLYTSRVIENATINTVVATVSATDADSGINAELVYSLSNSTKVKSYGKWFSINPVTGVVKTVTPIDREQAPQPVLIVVVSDKGTPSLRTNCTVVVNITDTNDNDPYFNQTVYMASIPENSASNSYVLHVYAKDPDLGDYSMIRYSIPHRYSIPFKIEPDSGAISSTSTIDHETNPAYSFQVVAIDGGGRKTFAIVNITIIDKNDNKPVFEPDMYYKEIEEDASIKTEIVTVTAHDKDGEIFSKVTYNIVNGNDDGLFTINNLTGVVSIAQKLDRETKDLHILIIEAVDGGGVPSTNNATVNVTVLDVNDEPPTFEHSTYNYTIYENSQPEVVGTVKATSKDLGTNALVTYSIIQGNVGSHFIINATGTIYLRTPVDHEKTPQVRLTIQAQDGGKPPLHSDIAVTIQVLDLNDNAPVFHVPNPGQVCVPENSKIGTEFYNLTATDKDSDANSRLTYSIIGGDGKDSFRIDPKTGLLSTNEIFDYESKSFYTLDVKVIDSGSPPLQSNISVIVDIASVDEYSPVFPPEGYEFKVRGDAKVGDVIGTVSATDLDDGEDGEVVYFFVNPRTDAIIINKTSGIITVNRTLNDGSELQKKRDRRSIDYIEEVLIGRSRSRREVDDNLYLTVHADSGKPNSKKATTAVSVKVDFTCDGCGIVTKGKQTGNGGISGTSLVIIVALAVLAGVVLLALIVVMLLIYGHRKRKKARKNPRLKFDGSFDEITVHPSSGNSNHGAVSAESIPTRTYPQEYTPLTRTTDNSNNGTSTEASETPGSASSGRGSSDGDYEESPTAYVNGDIGSLHSDNYVKTIIADSGIQDNEDDRISQLTISDGSGILHVDDGKSYKNDKVLSKMDFQSQESMHVFGEEGGGEADGGHDLLYAKLAEVDADGESISEVPRRFMDEDHGPYAGSLSSIIGSKEELSGSYNWDYLLDWGPQFQPLAEVFLEIGRMKNDAGVRSTSTPSSRHLPGIATTDMLSSVSSLPRSPISPPSTQFTSPAFSPNFTPAITPLITRSPSVSPLDTGTVSPAFSHPGSRPASANMQLARNRRDLEGDSNSELSHSPSISDNESNLEIEI